ncbi:MAG: hypothetical protein C4B56_06005 [Candidatus Methanophagaceae archaeon]|nr:MAG: hypothetical protein C4B56_06005 [Methanophagales archaeon]
MKKLQLFYDSKSREVVTEVIEALEAVFRIEPGSEAVVKDVDKEAYDRSRMQYNASILLNSITSTSARATTDSSVYLLWIVSEDIFVRGMNFVFGIAKPGKGAVLSTYRLDSLNLIKKEAIHEMGHVFGLQHCSNKCVMQFSNSVNEAKKKPAELCDKCKYMLNLLCTRDCP